MITIRQHCIPCYDFLRRLENVCLSTDTTFPPDFYQMEEQTAGGIIKKCKNIIDSGWFQVIVKPVVYIKSGRNNNYKWDKEKEKQEIINIYQETKDFLEP